MLANNAVPARDVEPKPFDEVSKLPPLMLGVTFTSNVEADWKSTGDDGIPSMPFSTMKLLLLLAAPFVEQA